MVAMVFSSHSRLSMHLLPNYNSNSSRNNDSSYYRGAGRGGTLIITGRRSFSWRNDGSPLPPVAAHLERTSGNEVKEEIQRCYQLVHKLGRGVVYLGSSRVNKHHTHYLQALQLARETAKLLDCTTWTGAGPGLMDAATQGALEAKKPVGGFKIAKESGEWTSSNFHAYLPPQTYLTCRFFSARKHGLVDAAVRNNQADMTAVVAFPGGIGTLDEVFEILALIQLERIGSKFPVPFLLLNYDSYYSKLLDFMDECEKWGTVDKGEVSSLWKVCSGNIEALEYLAEFYRLPLSKRNYNVTEQVEQGVVSYSGQTSLGLEG